MKELREILRELREDHDLKQETVASYLGIEQQSYSNYENGNRGIPIWVVIKLSDYYKVSTDYLLRLNSRSWFMVTSSSREASSMYAYLNNITLHDVLYDIQKLNSDNRKDLLRYLDYLKYINQ